MRQSNKRHRTETRKHRLGTGLKALRKTKTTPYSRIALAGKKVVIRPYRLSDFAKCRLAHDQRLPKANRFDDEIPVSKEKTYRSFKARIERYRNKGQSKKHFVFGVFEIVTGNAVGQVDVFTICEELRWANLGYQIHNQHWSKGFATEASALALRVAFEMLNFHRVEAATEPKNKASIHVAKRLGMNYEGVRKKFFPDQGGVDVIVFGANAIDFVDTRLRSHKKVRT